MARVPLLLEVAVRPHAAMRWILDNRGSRGILLLVLAAFGSSVTKEFDWRRFVEASDSVGLVQLAGIVIAGIVIGAALWVGMFYGIAWIATAAGRFFGGSGDYKSVRTALAWGLAPVILALIYRIPALMVWPAAMLAGGRNRPAVKVSDSIQITAQAFADIPGYQIAILMLLDAAILIWYLVVASMTLAEAQRISSWAGFGNLVLAVVLPVVGALAIAAAAYLAFK